MTKPTLPFIETMITQVCNLSCYGCTNYSDIQNEGYVTWNQGRKWLESWLERVDIPDFGIMGGEPLVNPEVSDWIYGVRELMPNSQIRFTTNGLLLKKKFEVVEQLAEIGNCVFKIGIHVNDPELDDIIEKIFSMYEWEPVVEFGVSRYKTKNNFRFHPKRPDTFWKTYKGEYSNMMPHNSNPEDAFKMCCQQTCPLMHNGKIYKCSTSGLLEETLSRFGNPNADDWKPYIDKGLDSNCTDKELQQWLSNFGKPNSICGQCPTENDLDSKIIHFENVSKKKVKP